MLQLRDSGGTLRTITTLQMRDAGGTLRTIASLYVRDSGGTLRQVFSAAGGGSGLVNPSYVNGTGRSNSVITVATKPTTASGSGTFAWVQTSGDSDWTIGNPTSASTYFVHANTYPDTAYNATFKVTINGSLTASISATVRNISGL